MPIDKAPGDDIRTTGTGGIGPRHPCADHMASCDHCYRCDVLGECCANHPTGDLVTQAVRLGDLARLRSAIERDLTGCVSLSDLIRTESAVHITHRRTASSPHPELRPPRYETPLAPLVNDRGAYATRTSASPDPDPLTHNQPTEESR